MMRCAPGTSWLGTWQDEGCSSRMRRRIARAHRWRGPFGRELDDPTGLRCTPWSYRSSRSALVHALVWGTAASTFGCSQPLIAHLGNVGGPSVILQKTLCALLRLVEQGGDA
jgi:hypothetical protein